MEHVIERPCGTVLRAADVETVVSEARDHAKTVHDMDLTDERATTMARPA
jgi:predicted small metal-binding protein